MKITTQRGAIPVRLDAMTPRILFFDMAATFLLVERYGIAFATELYEVPKAAEPGKSMGLRLKSAEALCFFIWVGLQAESLENGEKPLTLEQVKRYIRPFSIAELFAAVINALTGAVSTPAEPLPGKTEAASPAAKRAAKKATPKRKEKRQAAKRVSTLKVRHGLHSVR